MEVNPASIFVPTHGSAGEGRDAGQSSGVVAWRVPGRVPGPSSASDLEGVIPERVGVMLDARLGALEERLPLERAFRPLLGVKGSYQAAVHVGGRPQR